MDDDVALWMPFILRPVRWVAVWREAMAVSVICGGEGGGRRHGGGDVCSVVKKNSLDWIGECV